jgi:hypothetical protein
MRGDCAGAKSLETLLLGVGKNLFVNGLTKFRQISFHSSKETRINDE